MIDFSSMLMDDLFVPVRAMDYSNDGELPIVGLVQQPDAGHFNVWRVIPEDAPLWSGRLSEMAMIPATAEAFDAFFAADGEVVVQSGFGFVRGVSSDLAADLGWDSDDHVDSRAAFAIVRPDGTGVAIPAGCAAHAYAETWRISQEAWTEETMVLIEGRKAFIDDRVAVLEMLAAVYGPADVEDIETPSWTEMVGDHEWVFAPADDADDASVEAAWARSLNAAVDGGYEIPDGFIAFAACSLAERAFFSSAGWDQLSWTPTTTAGEPVILVAVDSIPVGAWVARIDSAGSLMAARRLAGGGWAVAGDAGCRLRRY